jgi:hypothetical protein
MSLLKKWLNDIKTISQKTKNKKENQMNIDKLVKASLTLAIAAALTGQLPKVIKEVRIAQLKLMKESQASKWGMPMLPPERH